MWDWKNSPPSVPGDPKKFLKLVLAISFGLLVLWVFVMAQTERSERQAVSVEDQQRLDSLRQALGTEEGERPVQQTDSQGMFFNALTTFLILGGLGLAFWWWYSRKLTGNQSTGGVGSGPIAKVVGSQQIGMGQEIKVIEINDEYWVLGISSQSVSLLHRYQKSEWKAADSFPSAGTEKQDSSFSKILSSLQQHKK